MSELRLLQDAYSKWLASPQFKYVANGWKLALDTMYNAAIAWSYW